MIQKTTDYFFPSNSTCRFESDPSTWNQWRRLVTSLCKVNSRFSFFFLFFLLLFTFIFNMQRMTATEDLTSVEWRDTNWLEVRLIEGVREMEY